MIKEADIHIRKQEYIPALRQLLTSQHVLHSLPRPDYKLLLAANQSLAQLYQLLGLKD